MPVISALPPTNKSCPEARVTLELNVDVASTVKASPVASPIVTCEPVNDTLRFVVTSPCTTNVPTVFVPAPALPMTVLPSSSTENSTVSVFAFLPTNRFSPI